MNDILIPNFIGKSPLTVTSSATTPCGNLVMLLQHGGAMNFQHAMTPQQARDMAAALVQMADSFEVAA